jgi:hypothetical protein
VAVRGTTIQTIYAPPTAIGTIQRTVTTIWVFVVACRPPVLLGPVSLMLNVHGRLACAAGIEEYRPAPGWDYTQPNDVPYGEGW